MFGGKCPFGHKPSDPFKEKREAGPVARYEFQGEAIPMILRHADVRQAARDWQTYSSDAPFRVPIPSEEEARSMRQLPIETNPPEHSEYRAIVEPFFNRPKDPAMVAQVERLIDGLVRDALSRESVEVVHGLALPLQARALTYLLNTDEREADIWIGWGIHVFRVRGGLKKGVELENYLQAKFDAASRAPGADFFSALTQACFQGRPLTREEMMGFANLAFAGGRVSLGWASANRDETVFPEADVFKIDRKPNPHLSFGFGEHLCLGAPHARLLLRTLLQKCVELVGALEIVSAEERTEVEHGYERKLGYESLVLRFRPRA